MRGITHRLSGCLICMSKQLLIHQYCLSSFNHMAKTTDSSGVYSIYNCCLDGAKKFPVAWKTPLLLIHCSNYIDII